MSTYIDITLSVSLRVTFNSWLYAFANKDLAKSGLPYAKKRQHLRLQKSPLRLAEQSWSLHRQVSSLSVSLGLTFKATKIPPQSFFIFYPYTVQYAPRQITR